MNKKFIDFIPAQYLHERGVFWEENNLVVCYDLRFAMEEGEYDWCGTHWKWEGPRVEFRSGSEYSHGWHYGLIWFLGDDGKWYGWQCYPRHKGTPVYWRVLNPDSPDFVSDEPKNSEDFYPDPCFDGVSEESFISAVSAIFGGDSSTPKDLAEIMLAVPYHSWHGGSRFSALPTPDGWGWVYETISGRQLIWVDGKVYSRGMRESVNFRATLASFWGEPVELSEPEWLESALLLAVRIQRPCIFEYGGEPKVYDNSDFFNAISSSPRSFYAGRIKPPTEPGKSFDFHAAMAMEHEAAQAAKMYLAYQELFS